MFRQFSTTIALSLFTLSVGGCAGDDPEEFPGRVPCASAVTVDGQASAVRTFVYDDAKRMTSLETHTPAGAPVDSWRGTWTGNVLSHVEWQQVYGGVLKPVLTFDATVVDGLVTHEDWHDLVGAGSYTVDREFQGRAVVREIWNYADPAYDDVTVTIEGDRSPLATERTCPANMPCSVCVRTQPDSDPRHWTRMVCDLNDNGTDDVVYEQTFDAHDQRLTWTSSEVASGQLRERATYAREADGTLLTYTDEEFVAGNLLRTTVETFDFDCTSARPVDPRVMATDAAAAASRRLPMPLAMRADLPRSRSPRP